MAKKILIQGSVIRASYGILALLFPKVLFAVARMEEEQEARYFNRLFGGRDLLVALMTVGAARNGSEGAAVKANMFCELTDSVSLAEELRARGKPDTATIIGLLFNVGGYATWFRAALALRNPSASSAQSS